MNHNVCQCAIFYSKLDTSFIRLRPNIFTECFVYMHFDIGPPLKVRNHTCVQYAVTGDNNGCLQACWSCIA
jgi:hypothetical protein